MQVSQLLASRNFQRHSGPVLESLSLQPDNETCFNFDASPEAYPVRPSSCLAQRDWRLPVLVVILPKTCLHRPVSSTGITWHTMLCP